ncbi:MAG: MCE family protein [Bdellovibrionales bacterium]|nr:MCE family protein [Bdellovibrionales bacterium]
MKLKFNLFERVAGMFVLTAIASAVGTTVGMGIKKGWFETKVDFKTYVKTADGIHSGTPVHLAGLQVGSVESVDLIKGQEVEIHFRIIKRFTSSLTRDSKVRVVRPFIIGEKVLEVDAGEGNGGPVKPGQVLVAEYAPDLLDLLGGNKLGSYVESLNSAMQNLQKLAEAFLSNERSDKIIELFDQMVPLMDRMNSMASEVSTLSATLNENRKMAKAMDQFLFISEQMNETLPAMGKVSKDMPQLTKNILELSQNLNSLTKDMQEIVPIVKEMAPQFPEASQKAVRALDETVVTLKAMQKTFFLRSSVREVKEEEKQRKPANK